MATCVFARESPLDPCDLVAYANDYCYLGRYSHNNYGKFVIEAGFTDVWIEPGRQNPACYRA